MARSSETKDEQMHSEPALYINDAMDYIGYSKESIGFRRALYSQMNKHINETCNNILSLLDVRKELFLTGSKGEGVAKMAESDMDMLLVYRNFVCVDDGHTENDITVVKTHMTDSPPGYTKLIPLNIDSERVESSLLDLTTVYDIRQGLVFILSSCAFHEASIRNVENLYDGMHIEVKERTGPSSPTSIKFNFGGCFATICSQQLPLDADNVFAMPYFSATILKCWSERSRMYDWPSHDVINDVSTMEGYVVPVGPKYCEEQNLEWRISYTTAENRLVSSLNAVQLKIYVLIKMIFKQIIKNECDFISSFMIKTVIFWVCERTDIRVFTPENLLKLLCQALSFLLLCLNANFLPNYLIPSSNLLLGKGSPQERLKLRRILRTLLNNGGLDVLRVEKLSVVANVILKNPTFGKKYGQWRDELEKQSFSLSLLQAERITSVSVLRRSFVHEYFFESFKDPRYLPLVFYLLKLLNVDIADLVLNPIQTMQYIINASAWHLS